jgi:hypothetical protein
MEIYICQPLPELILVTARFGFEWRVFSFGQLASVAFSKP